MGKKRSKGGNNSKNVGKKTSGSSANPVAAETISLLEQSQLSPHYKATPEQRRRLQRALASAQYVPDCLELLHNNERKSSRAEAPTGGAQIVLYHGGSLQAAEWANQQLRLQQFNRSGRNVPESDWYKPVVLDFASDSNPGGGWRGHQQGTQEEAICRVSSLGLSLERLSPYSIPSGGCVYVPDVAVIRHDDAGGSPSSWKESPLWCSVIAAALRSAENHEWILSKIRGVMAVASAANHGALVGGAWGCGAFGNDVEAVAEAWRVAAKGFSSDDLELLVLALPSKQMLHVFQSVMPNATIISRSEKT